MGSRWNLREFSMRVLQQLVLVLLVTASLGGKKRGKGGNGGKGRDGGGNGGGGGGNGGGGGCSIQYYTVQETQYQTSCSNSYRTECSTSYSSSCGASVRPQIGKKCTEQTNSGPVTVCENEVQEVDCTVRGRKGSCYLDKNPKTCRSAGFGTQKVESCVPVYSAGEFNVCQVSPQKKCKQVPSKSCSKKPITVQKQVGRRVCG